MAEPEIMPEKGYGINELLFRTAVNSNRVKKLGGFEEKGKICYHKMQVGEACSMITNMKSLRTKILFLIVACVLLAAISLGGAGFLSAKEVVERDSVQIVNLQCSMKAQEIDERFRNIKQSVETITQYVQRRIDLNKIKSDEEYQHQFLDNLETLFQNATGNTEGAVTSYFRLNPELSENVSGIFLVRNSMKQTFEKHELTNLDEYDKDDLEHVGWYYLPIQNESATWLGPYYNKNINAKMVSYIIPIFRGDITIGVVGMDIDIALLKGVVDSIKLYEDGYAFLVGEKGEIIYHKDFPDGLEVEQYDEKAASIRDILISDKKENVLYSYEWMELNRNMMMKKLENGMYLAVTVPSDEINAPRDRLLFQIIVAVVVILILSIALTIYVTGLVVRPLRYLTDAARRIAAGNLEVSIQCNSKDEIGVLAESFEKTVSSLKHYIDYFNHLAYTDAMTGAQNKMAYEDRIEQLEKTMENEYTEFTVVVMDINHLKQMNDTYGHEYGDMLITDAAVVMKKAFGGQSVFRIGGDEFTVILEGEECKKSTEMLSSFDETLVSFNEKNTRYKEKLQIACGVAEYEKGRDKTFKDVFARADKRMYENKAFLKQGEK